MLTGDGFHETEEAHVDGPVLAFYEAVEEMERHLVLDKAVEHVELGERPDDAGECPIGLDECRGCEQMDTARQPEDNDIFTVVAKDVVSLVLNHFGEVRRHPLLSFIPTNDVFDVSRRQGETGRNLQFLSVFFGVTVRINFQGFLVNYRPRTNILFLNK